MSKFAFPCQLTMHFKVYKENSIQSDQHNHLLSFRIYDREGNGYITTDVLKEILKEIDPGLTNDDLDNIIEEVDEDGSGTLDFDGELSFGAPKINYENGTVCFRVPRDDDGMI